MNNLHPIFQTILEHHGAMLRTIQMKEVDVIVCHGCGESPSDCICDQLLCNHCGVTDVPVYTRSGRMCAACGESVDEINEDM